MSQDNAHAGSPTNVAKNKGLGAEGEMNTVRFSVLASGLFAVRFGLKEN